MSTVGLKQPLGSNLAQSVQSQKSHLPSVSSLVKNMAIAGLSLTALAGLTQLVYNSYLSPSLPKHNLASSAIEAYYNRYVTECDDTSFKVLQTFLNIFETSHKLFNALGLNNNEPPGDLQAFAMDANFKGLYCSLKSYPKDYFSNEMKSILLGRVLTQIQFNQKDLGAVASWLIDQGANPNLQAKMPRKELLFAFESTLTPLMTAYRSLNSTLYADFIARGANPSQEIYTYSSGTNQFENKISIVQAIVEDIIRTTQKFQNVSDAQLALQEAYLCPIYKAIIDSSLKQLAKKDLQEKMLIKLRFRLYLKIQEYICKKTFSLTQEEEHEHRSEEMKNSFYDACQGAYDFFKKTTESSGTESSGDVPVQDVKVNEDPLQAEKFQKEFETFTKYSESMGAAMDTLRVLIKDTANSLHQVGSDIANSEPVQVISEGIKGAGIAMKDTAKKAGQLTVDAARGLGQIGLDIANSKSVQVISEGIKDAGVAMKDTAKKAGQLTVDAARGLGQIGLDIANSEPVQVISEGIKGAGIAIKDTAKKAGQLTVDAAHGLGQVGLDIANSNTVQVISEGIKGAGVAIQESAKKAGQLTVDGAEKASKAFSGAIETVEDVFQASYERAGQVARVVSENVADAKEALGEFAGRVKKSTGELVPK